jgi:hypothetical protein
LQQRLAALQVAQIVHRKRALIIFEGWTCSGKRAALKRLVASWDPCHLSTRCVGGSEHGDDERHWLAPFWSALHGHARHARRPKITENAIRAVAPRLRLAVDRVQRRRRLCRRRAEERIGEHLPSQECSTGSRK